MRGFSVVFFDEMYKIFWVVQCSNFFYHILGSNQIKLECFVTLLYVRYTWNSGGIFLLFEFKLKLRTVLLCFEKALIKYCRLGQWHAMRKFKKVPPFRHRNVFVSCYLTTVSLKIRLKSAGRIPGLRRHADDFRRHIFGCVSGTVRHRLL